MAVKNQLKFDEVQDFQHHRRSWNGPKKYAIKTPLNALPDPGRTITDPHQIVPDETLSMREIMARYSRGLPIPNTKSPFYDLPEDSEDFEGLPDPRKLDLAEMEDLKIQAKANTERIQKELRDQKQREKAKAAAAAAEDVRKASEARQQTPTPDNKKDN